MNSNIQTLTTIWCVIIFLSIAESLYAQTSDALFKVVSNAETVLSASELNRYADLDNDKIKEKALIDITGLEQALQNSVLSVPLKGTDHSLRSTNFSNAKAGSFTFKGTFTEALGEVYLYQTDGYLYGNIHIDSLAYQIEPVNKKFAVLLRRDYSDDICPLGEEHGEKEDSGENQQNDSSKSKSALMSNPVIDVMVLFSNQAAAATSNMQALAEGSIQSSNDSFSNSDAGVSFNLVHYQQISYNESGNAVTDRDRLIATSDGYMDNAHSLRNQYGADVVVLIVSNSPGLCGIAGGIGVSSSNAFAVSVDDCSIGNYTFAHEIGHLAGARHDNDGNDDPYEYGHGFRYEPAYWRTVMAVYDDYVNRIPYWSNPDKYYGGIAMGTTSWNDNARVWDERAATVAGFKSTGPSVYISGPGHIPSGASATYYANVSGGVSPYDYQWYKNGSPVGTNSSSYQLNTYPSDEGIIIVSVTVTDDNNNSDSDDYQVFIDPNKKIVAAPTPQEYNLSASYPNPFNPSTQISYQLPEQSSVTLEVFDVMGRKVATLVNTNQAPGTYAERFNASGLSSGLYIARINAIGNSGEAFSKELKMQLVK